MAGKKTVVNDSFIKDLVDQIADKSFNVLTEADDSSEISEYYDTGSYMMNALVSGDIYKGVPCNKVTTFARRGSYG